VPVPGLSEYWAVIVKTHWPVAPVAAGFFFE
jgi:hypothetical protein